MDCVAQKPSFGDSVAAPVIALLASLTAAVTIGPVAINPIVVWKIIGAHVLAIDGGDWSNAHDNIVWLIRLPRVLLAGVIGASLSVVGAAMQATVRNPIADPIYSWTFFGSVGRGRSSDSLFGLNVFGLYSLSIAAFLGALGAFAIVFLLAQHRGRLTPVRLILVGVAASYVFSSVTSFLIFRAQESRQVQAVLFWLAGSVAGAEWSFLTIPTVVLAAGTGFLMLQARAMNGLIAGEETAVTLGINTSRFRRQLMAVASLLTGVIVAVAGSIGFVGLTDASRGSPVCGVGPSQASCRSPCWRALFF